MSDAPKKLASSGKAGLTAALLSIVWWGIVSHGSWQRLVLAISLSLASFTVGSVAGFLFTSYGEETATVGRIRDWLIAGLTGVTIAKASSVKTILFLFAAGPGPGEFAFVIGNAALYSGIGFYFMFFQRELSFNVLLAKTRAERVKLEGNKQATSVVEQLLIKLPPSVLTGVDLIGDADINSDEAARLRGLLYSDDAEKFLEQAEDAIQSGQLDWDIVSKTAYIHYYRTYFEEKNREGEVDRASEWLVRCLNMNPMHMDLTMKYAEMLGNKKDYESAAAILERLVRMPESPVIVRQWLGFYLRYLPDRLDDAIRYSRDVPCESPTTKHQFSLCVSFDAGQSFHPSQARGADNRPAVLAALLEGFGLATPDYIFPYPCLDGYLTNSRSAEACLLSEPLLPSQLFPTCSRGVSALLFFPLAAKFFV